MQKALGETIKRLRQARGMTQGQLGEKVGTDATNIGRVEYGRQGITFARLEAIAAALGVTIVQLLELAESGRTHGASVPRSVRVPVRAIITPHVAGAVPNTLPEKLWLAPHDGELGWVLYPTSDRHAYAVEIRGDTLSPRIKAGEYLVIEPSVPPQPGDEIGIRFKDGRRAIRLLVARIEGGVRIMDVNERGPMVTLYEDQFAYLTRVAGVANASLHLRSEGHTEPPA